MAKDIQATDASRAPRVSFVSLGCPALVDSERIITRLRAEGYELRGRTKARTSWWSTPAAFDSAQAESLAAIGNALSENGKVIVTSCMGAEPEDHRSLPDVLAVTDRSNTSVLEAVHRAAPPRTIRFSISCRPKASS
jgi:ribosomal protein S12 methylthiotransferase